MSGNTPEQKANLPQAVETENKTEEGVGEKKVEDKWSAAIGLSGIVALLGALEFYLCISSQIWDDKFMNVIGGYDKGSLLGVLAIVGIIAAMVGAYGIVLCAYCKKPGMASRLRYMIYGYIGWGGGTVCMLIASAVLTFSGSKQLEVMFKSGFSQYITKYEKEEWSRSQIDYLQQKLKCCGSWNYTEWFVVDFSEKVAQTDVGFPESCCRETPCVSLNPRGEVERLTPYKSGCIDEVVKYYRWTLHVRAMLLVPIAIVEAAALVFIVTEAWKLPPLPPPPPPPPPPPKMVEKKPLIKKSSQTSQEKEKNDQKKKKKKDGHMKKKKKKKKKKDDQGSEDDQAAKDDQGSKHSEDNLEGNAFAAAPEPDP